MKNEFQQEISRKSSKSKRREKRIITENDTRNLGNVTKIVIDDSAFMKFGNLKEVVLPKSITKIGEKHLMVVEILRK